MEYFRQFIRNTIRDFLNENIVKDNNLILYHGTGEKQEVIKALKNNTFRFNKSGGVENGMYLTTNKELAMQYSEIANGNDKGVVEVILTKEPKIKRYKNPGELYDEEMSYSPHNTKDSILKYLEDMLSQGYDGTQTDDEVILIFKEKINIVKPLKM